MTITLEYVQRLPLEKLHVYALKHLQNLERKKIWNRKYNALPEIREKQRLYYYKKHDIYHPDLNPQGLNEKRFKRTKLPDEKDEKYEKEQNQQSDTDSKLEP